MRIHVRLSIQNTVSHKADRVESVELVPALDINLHGIGCHQSCTTVWPWATCGMVLVNSLQLREIHATDLHEVVSSAPKRHEHAAVLQKLDQCDNTVITNQLCQAGPSISLQSIDMLISIRCGSLTVVVYVRFRQNPHIAKAVMVVPMAKDVRRTMAGSMLTEEPPDNELHNFGKGKMCL